METMTTAVRRWYAVQHPRGFANETDFHTFASRTDRDRWVAEHRDDGDVNAAYCGAHAVTLREYQRALHVSEFGRHYDHPAGE